MFHKVVVRNQPLCETFNIIQSTITSICTLLNLIFGFEAEAGECFLKFKVIDDLWYGENYGTDEFDPTYGSTKSMFSVGYLCDLVLCSECDNFWKTGISDLTDFDVNNFARGLKFSQSGWGSAKTENSNDNSPNKITDYDPQIAFDPQQSMLVAILCNPPCLTGILSKLKAYKNILTTYNTCLNVAQVRGYDQFGCEDYLTSATCRYIWVGEWWYIIENFISSYITQYAVYIFEQKILQFSECPDGCPFNKACQANCFGRRIYHYASWIITYLEVVEAYTTASEKLKDLSGSDVENEV